MKTVMKERYSRLVDKTIAEQTNRDQCSSMIWHRAMLLCALVAILAGIMTTAAHAQIGSGTLVIHPLPSEDFNSLATGGLSNSILPNGWFIHENATCRFRDRYAASSGSDPNGDTYSFGTSGDRALGHLGSPGCPSVYLGARILNNSSSMLTSLTISYHCEHWRARTGTPDRMTFAYSTNATSLLNGIWTSVSSLDCTETATSNNSGPINGNAIRTFKQDSLNDLNVPVNGVVWIRWTGNRSSFNSDDGIGIDDFAIVEATAIELASFGATANGDGTVAVAWTTSTEIDNAGFNLYRNTAPSFDVHAAVQLNATLISTQGQFGQGATYEWIDSDVTPGVWYYFLEEIDLSGVGSLHGPVSVDTSAPTSAELSTFQGENSGVTLSAACLLVVLGLLGLFFGRLIPRQR